MTWDLYFTRQLLFVKGVRYQTIQNMAIIYVTCEHVRQYHHQNRFLISIAKSLMRMQILYYKLKIGILLKFMNSKITMSMTVECPMCRAWLNVSRLLLLKFINYN